jgi:hypothetical protein
MRALLARTFRVRGLRSPVVRLEPSEMPHLTVGRGDSRAAAGALFRPDAPLRHTPIR